MVDLVVLARARRRNPGLLADALHEGRVVVDRGGVWPALQRKERSVRRAARRHEARLADEAGAALNELLSA